MNPNEASTSAVRPMLRPMLRPTWGGGLSLHLVHLGVNSQQALNTTYVAVLRRHPEGRVA